MASHRICIALASVVLGGGAWLCGPAALAQHEPPRVVMRPVAPGPTQVSPLVVEATKPAELKRQTYNFVQNFTATTYKLDQVARWTQGICVTVQGLPPDAAAEVKARVEEVANALKVGVRKAGCRPNIQVAFTAQPQALLDRVAGQSEQLLGYWHHRDRDKLKTVIYPVQAWYVTGTAGSGGGTAGMAFMNVDTWGDAVNGVLDYAPGPAEAGAVGNQPHGDMVDDENNGRSPTGCADSKFSSCLLSQFLQVLVVVDTNRVQDYPPGLIADYVVMVSMAQPKSLDGCNVLPSVIDLFSAACPDAGKDGLTRADVAYLTALYKIDLQSKRSGQETDIANRMADMLLKANAADRLAKWGGPTKVSTGK